VIVIDSVAALVPKAEIEGEMGDSHMGLQARLMSQALRKLTGRSQVELLGHLLNQLREGRDHVRQPRTQPGGRA
jgi:recombination protein RecA